MATTTVSTPINNVSPTKPDSREPYIRHTLSNFEKIAGVTGVTHAGCNEWYDMFEEYFHESREMVREYIATSYPGLIAGQKQMPMIGQLYMFDISAWCSTYNGMLHRGTVQRAKAVERVLNTFPPSQQNDRFAEGMLNLVREVLTAYCLKGSKVVYDPRPDYVFALRDLTNKLLELFLKMVTGYWSFNPRGQAKIVKVVDKLQALHHLEIAPMALTEGNWFIYALMYRMALFDKVVRKIYDYNPEVSSLCLAIRDYYYRLATFDLPLRTITMNNLVHQEISDDKKIKFSRDADPFKDHDVLEGWVLKYPEGSVPMTVLMQAIPANSLNRTIHVSPFQTKIITRRAGPHVIASGSQLCQAGDGRDIQRRKFGKRLANRKSILLISSSKEFKKCEKRRTQEMNNLRDAKRMVEQMGLTDMLLAAKDSLPGGFPIQVGIKNQDKILEAVNNGLEHKLEADVKEILVEAVSTFKQVTQGGVKIDVTSSMLQQFFEKVKNFIIEHSDTLISVVLLIAIIWTADKFLWGIQQRNSFFMIVLAAIGIAGISTGPLSRAILCAKEYFEQRWSTKEKSVVDTVLERNPNLQEEQSGEVFYEQAAELLESSEILDFGLDPSFLQKAIGLVLFGTVFKGLDSDQPMFDFLKKAQSIKKMQEGGAHCVSFMLQIVQDMVNYCISFVDEKKKVSFYSGNFPDVTKFSMNVTDLLDNKSWARRNGMEFANRVTAFINYGNRLMTTLPATPEGREAKQICMYSLSRLTPIANQLANSNLSSGGPRVEPVGIMLAGSPGSGKSICANMLAYELCARTMPAELLPVLRKTPNAHVYNRMIEHGYWDGFLSAWVTMIDDALQLKDVAGVFDNQLMEFVRMINTNPYILHMADISSKGCTEFHSKFVVSTTNMMDIAGKIQSIHDPEAYTRRFKLSLRVVPKEEFSEDPKADREKRKLKKGMEFVADFRHLEFWDWKMTSAGECNSPQKGQWGDGPFTYQQIMDRILVAYEKNLKLCEDINASILTRINSIIDGRMVEQSGELINEFGLRKRSDSPTFDGAFKDSMTELAESEPSGFAASVYDDVEKMYHEPFAGCFNTFHEIIDTGSKVLDGFILNQLLKVFMIDKQNENDQCRETFSEECIGKLYPPTVLNHQQFDTLMETWDKKFENYHNNIVSNAAALSAPPAVAKVIDSVVKTNLTFFERLRQHAPTLRRIGKGIAGMIAIFGIVKFFQKDKDEQSSERRFRGKASRRPIRKRTVVNPTATVGFEQASGALQKIEQIAGDKTVDDKIASHIKNNVFEVRIPKLNIRLGTVLILAGLVGLEPQHYWAFVDRAIEDKEIGEYDIISFHPITADSTNGYFEMYAIEFLDMAEIIPGLAENVDLMAFKLPPGLILPRKNIVDSFLYEKDRPNIGFKGTLVVPKAGSGVTIYVTNMTPVWNAVHGSMQDWLTPYGVKYNIATQTGTCGSLVYAVKPFANHGGRLLGMHVRGDNVTEGGAIGISRELAEQAVKFMCTEKEFKEQIGWRNEVIVTDVWEGSPGFMPLRRVDTKDTVISGKATFGKVPSTQTKSNIIPGPLNGKIENFVPKTKPAYLNKTPSGVEVLPKAQQSYNHANCAVSQPILDVVFDSYMGAIADRVTFDPWDQRESFDTWTAIRGKDDDPNWKAIPRQTSPGVPYSILLPKKYKGKTAFFGNGEDYEKGPMYSELEKDVEEMESKLRQGIIPESVYMDFPKDERRPIEKVNEGKTRLVSGVDIVTLIVGRKHFGPLLSFMMKNKFAFGLAVGMNPMSSEWDAMVSWLRGGMESTSFDGDFKHYDGSQVLRWMRIILIISKWYFKDRENDIIRETLLYTISSSVHYFKGMLYMWFNGMPSGNWLTVFLNSLDNNCIIRYTAAAEYAEVHEIDPMLRNDGDLEEMITFMQHFEDLVRIMTLGDDNLVNVSGDMQEYCSMSIMAKQCLKFGFEYTAADKSDKIIDFKPITECTFLKRHFIWDKYLCRWVGALSLDTILEMIQWTKKEDIELLWHNNKATIDIALKELSFWPEDVWNEWSPRILKAASEEMGYYPVPADYISCKRLNASRTEVFVE